MFRTVSIVMCLFLVGCRPPEPVLPAVENPFACKLVFQQLSKEHDAVPVSDGVPVLTVAKNRGFVMQIGLEVCDAVPGKVSGRGVSPVLNWPLVVVTYPKMEGDSSSRVLKGGVFEIDPPGVKRMARRIEYPQHGFWHCSGFNEWKFPKQPIGKLHEKRWREGKTLWYWTFICADKDQVGEFVVEVRLFPTAKWVSALRAEFGDHVVLKRFHLNVTPD